MAGEKNIETSELIAPGPMSASSTTISGKDMGKDGIQSDSAASKTVAGDATYGVKGVMDQSLGPDQNYFYMPANFYDYFYPGYNGTYAQSDDKNYYNSATGSYTGTQSDNASLLYYYPGYTPYAPGYMGVDGKQTYATSEYLQQQGSYGSEIFPSYMYDSSYYAGLTGTGAKSGSVMGPSGSGKSNGFNAAAKTNNNLSSKASALPFNSRYQQPSSHYSKPLYQNQPLKPLNKLGSGFQSTALAKGYDSVGKYSSFSNRNPGVYMQYGPLNYQANSRTWNNFNYRYKSRDNTVGRNGEFEALNELTRGPRADNRNNTSSIQAEVEQPELAIEKDKYNLDEFVTEYENAKFYVIKSYSEDDIHKCMKYDVWSSTPNGNKKLDAAFGEAEAKSIEIGSKCPVFLFFSVNGSGQFVGVAEMIGHVDFGKNMDFWQLDKWNGFFPIKWHIIKDVPNTQLRHIILENNENRPVTYSRDTQEIGLKQGLEILGIFKNYSQKTSVLDDFKFYENREKTLKAKRNLKPASQTSDIRNGDYGKLFNGVDGSVGEQSVKINDSDASSLISLTKNLSLNSQPLKSSI